MLPKPFVDGLREIDMSEDQKSLALADAIKKSNQYKIEQLMIDNDLSLIDVVDAVIEANGIIGVGLITLGDQLQEHCRNKIRTQHD
jgi:hypothetical protein